MKPRKAVRGSISPDVYEYLEDKGILYAVRIPANDVLLRKIDHLMKRPKSVDAIKGIGEYCRKKMV